MGIKLTHSGIKKALRQYITLSLYPEQKQEVESLIYTHITFIKEGNDNIAIVRGDKFTKDIDYRVEE